MKRDDQSISIWLFLVAISVFLMVAIGGITRLTGSGLSIVDWRPLMGSIPPLNEESWREVFEKYQQFPQFKIVNHRMGLNEFKEIFFWEFLHRLWGRLIGLIFFFPYLYFSFKKKISPPQLLLPFILGGLQGLLGWYMVKSGLVQRPEVSHYRLAAHLILAVIIYAILLWEAFQYWPRTNNAPQQLPFNKSYLRALGIVLSLLFLVQIFYGALMAGLHAGIGNNTFPDMEGHFYPPEANYFSPFILNFFENPVMIQFVHRLLAWTLLFGTLVFFVACSKFKQENGPLFSAASILLGAITLQFGLGVSTLILRVPLSLAVAHQLGALVFLSSLVYVWVTLWPSKKYKIL